MNISKIFSVLSKSSHMFQRKPDAAIVDAGVRVTTDGINIFVVDLHSPTSLPHIVEELSDLVPKLDEVLTGLRDDVL